MNLLIILTYAAAAPLMMACLIVLIECVAAALKSTCRHARTSSRRPRIAVVIPAHNEEASLPDTLNSLYPQMLPGDRIVVVADNCSDRTAEVARQGGAQVIERLDESQRGKGFALARGIEELHSDPPEIVLIVDADCRVRDGAVDQLALHVLHSNRPAQAVYLMEPSASAGLRERVSAFAFMVRGQVRAGGLASLGLPCLLGGTGMAFPWKAISAAQPMLKTGNIVEDMQLALDLAIAGWPATYCHSACVVSRHAEPGAAGRQQRTRWEHGHLKTLLTQVPRLIGHGLLRAKPGLIGLALDLAVPPLSLLVMLLAGMTALAGLLGLTSAQWGPFLFLTSAWLSLLGAVVLAWWRFGRSMISLLMLLGAPLYALSKIPIYLRFLLRPERDWLRTARHNEG